MLQMRPSGGGLAYSPYRDIANMFPQIARRSAYLLSEDCREDWFSKFITDHKITDEELVEASKAVANYINEIIDPTTTDVETCLDKSGFSALPLPVQMAFLVKIGQVTMSTFYACARDALRPGENPMGMQELLELEKQMSDKLLNKTS